jgi:hypothetical protein
MTTTTIKTAAMNNTNRILELQDQIKTIEIAWLMSVGDSGSSDYDKEFAKLRSAQNEMDSIAA